jgi:hypothetical protein
MYILALVAFETNPGRITYAYTVVNGAPSKASTTYLILDIPIVCNDQITALFRSFALCT